MHRSRQSSSFMHGSCQSYIAWLVLLTVNLGDFACIISLPCSCIVVFRMGVWLFIVAFPLGVSLGCPHLSGFRGYECTHTQTFLQNVFSVAHAGSKAVCDADTVRLSSAE